MMEMERACTGNNRCPDELGEKIFKKSENFRKGIGKVPVIHIAPGKLAGYYLLFYERF